MVGGKKANGLNTLGGVGSPVGASVVGGSVEGGAGSIEETELKQCVTQTKTLSVTFRQGALVETKVRFCSFCTCRWRFCCWWSCRWWL
jgi:hypothetical protein